MKLAFYRGAIPTDRNPKEIMFKSLDADTDMWTHLASALGDEYCDIIYTGGKREVKYSKTCRVLWIKNIDSYKPLADIDVVFCRGGFPEGDRLVRMFPKAVRVYTGCGKRYYPQGKEKYGIVLVDSHRQFEKVMARGMNAVLWRKPAAPCFKPISVPKEFDVCYVADGRFPFRAKIKNLKWTYRSLPADLSMLHLGWSGKYKPSKKICVKRVLRSQMPEEYSRCKVGVVPYSDYDSAPRVIPEMIACGLPVICLDSVHTLDGVLTETKENFWDKVQQVIEVLYVLKNDYPGSTNSIFDCAKYLKGVINGIR